ncbi:MAG: hypothetical protein G3I10_09475 [Ferrovum sp.]|nr:hypothetical protein [Ferrovum sp.]
MNPLPQEMLISNQEKRILAAKKRQGVLAFLGSGEIYSTSEILSDLLQLSDRVTRRLLQQMSSEKERLLKVDVLPTTLKLYGITHHGLAVSGADPRLKAFEIGKTNPGWVPHHIESQQVRIKAERSGWIDWVPGRVLMVENQNRLKKLPDSLATRPDGRKVAIEVERFVKSRKRLAVVLGEHLKQIADQKYDFVYYFTPHPQALERALVAIQFVVINAERAKFSDAQRSRFRVLNLKSWNGQT